MPNPAAEIERLRREIRHYDRKYYVEAAPEISDLEYDRLMERLGRLEAAHPELRTPDSPTQRVGEEPVEGLEEVEHRLPMLSIDNTYSIEELKKYAERTDKLLRGESIEWVVELKIDGVAVSLMYEEGQLVRGVTRGNGRVGDDVTHNMRTVRDVPLRLAGDGVPPVLEVRGEVYMTNSDLVRLNQEQERQGKPPFANTRNVTAGSIRQLDPRVCAERRLRFFAHGVGYVEGLKSQTHVEFLDELAGYGLPISPQVECFGSFDAALAHCEELIERLHELDFEIDGLVLKVNRFDQRERLGATSKSPRWLVAYKFEKYEATTRVNHIRVQVGKTGAITPVADLEPVEIAGTVVSRASLHNADEIERKDVRVGDTVVVEKAGKIIPHVVRVEKHLREGRPRKFVFPTECPECGTKVVRDTKGEKGEQGVYIRCPNVECPAQLKERIQYFASRNAMDIEGLGDKLVEQLVDKRLVTGYGDLYRLSAKQLEGIERVDKLGPNQAKKLVEGIQTARHLSLAEVLYYLAVPSIDAKTAIGLAREFKSMRALLGAKAEKLGNVDEVGPLFSQELYRALHREDIIEEIADLQRVGLEMNRPLPDSAQVEELRKKKARVSDVSEADRFAASDRIEHFSTAIKGLGKTTVDQLIEKGVARTCADLFRLTVEQLQSLDRIVRMGPKSTGNLLRNVESSKGRGLTRLLNALAIRHVGARVATVLAEHFRSMDELLDASVDELSAINEIGPIIAESVHEFLHSKHGRAIIQDLRRVGVSMESTAPTVEGRDRPLEGKTLVVTGTLERYTRDHIHELIEQAGGRAASSVSKNTDYLVAGEKAGSKLAKAQQLGVRVITEEEFTRLVGD